MTTVLLIDNYDSFVYNIAQYLGELGAEVEVRRNDSPDLDRLIPTADGFVLSPGPGHPKDSGRTMDVASNDGFGRPVLGVCLGHQAIAYANGAAVGRAGRVVHGKVSKVRHVPDELFEGVPEVFNATRYHSLVVQREGLPASIQVTAETEAGEIMALRLAGKKVFGVQFHPESIMTSCGKTILSNFLGMCRR
jgi:anthranilate synthase/aminodeoxychorismate synthase-like glutamine amidotransferase